MRTEQEMLALILDTARQDERIRAVIMNGSRANPHAPRDPFQDYDIVYLVTDLAPFTYAYDWIRRFGEMLVMQMPEDMQDPPPSGSGRFTYLMQFTDGNRMDLCLVPIARLGDLDPDSLSVLLLDKDGLIPPFPPPSDHDYVPKPPSAKAFADCCNEFWWVSPYVAKGLWRDEIPYAKHVLDHYVRDQLVKMLTWYVGLRTQFTGNPGKAGAHLRRYLEPDLWDLLLHTYSDADPDHIWDALLAMGRLFRGTALPVADALGFAYPHTDDARVTAHLAHIRSLPRDAQAIY